MPRLFVAIDLPPQVKDALAALETHIPTARWVKPEAMHLTLRFIGGDVPDAQVEPIQSALAQVEADAFTLALHGVGRFPPGKKPPSVLWVGLVDQPALLTLHGEIERALAAVGFPPESRPFSPHLTLARLKATRPVREADAFLADNREFTAGPITVDAFHLYASLLAPQGPRYTREGSYRLQSSP